MSDFNLRVSVRNARLLRRIRQVYGTQAELGRAIGITTQKVNALVAMRETPTLATGEWREVAIDIAGALGVTCEDLWPEHIANRKLKKSSAEVECSLSEVAAIVGNGTSQVEHRQLIGKLACRLTDREIKAICLRQSGATYDEAAAEFGVSKERVRQIELKGLSKMRAAANRLGVKTMADVE